MTDQEPQPKLTAMQKADKALEGLDELRGNLAHLTELLSGLPAADAKAVLAISKDTELHEKVADLEALVLAGQATSDAQAVTDNIAGLRKQLEAKYDNDAAAVLEGVVRSLQEAVRGMVGDVAQLREWQAAELDEDQADGLGALQERVAELESQLRLGRFEPASTPVGVRAPHVLQLIVELKKHVGAVGKDRQASHTGGRYAFRGVDDAMNAVGNACNVVGIVPPRATVISSETSRHVVGDRIWTSTTCTMRYTFQSPVDGSEWSTEGIGEGRDLADKSVTKAQAAALKYALFHGLAIPIEGMNMDAEQEHPVMEGRPVDQGSHEYRKWELAAERQEQREYEQHQREPQYPAAQEAPAQAQGSRFASKLEAAQYCLDKAQRVATLAELNQILGYAQKFDLMDVQVDGSPLSFRLISISRQLPPAVGTGAQQ